MIHQITQGPQKLDVRRPKTDAIFVGFVFLLVSLVTHDYLIGWLVDWLFGWLVGWLVDLTAWVIDRLVCCRLVSCSVGWLVDQLIGRSVGYLFGQLISQSTVGLAVRLIGPTHSELRGRTVGWFQRFVTVMLWTMNSALLVSLGQRI